MLVLNEAAAQQTNTANLYPFSSVDGLPQLLTAGGSGKALDIATGATGCRS
jgi:hypothetical protein